MSTPSPPAVIGGPVLPLEPTQDDRLLRRSVSSISRKYGPSYFQRVSAAGAAPTELWKELGDAGFLAVHLPERYGGGCAGLSELSAVVEQTAAAGVPAPTAVFSAGVNGTILAQHGTPEQKQRWLRPLAERAAVSSFAITEPDAGTNSFAINTWARPDGADFVINGMKYYISGMEEAKFLLVVARTGTDERTGRGLLTLFVVDADARGLSRQAIPTALQVPEQQSTVYFENVRLSADRIVGTVDRGMKAAFAGINAERLLVSSICIGVGRYALDKAVAYAKERSAWGVPMEAIRLWHIRWRKPRSRLSPPS